MSSKIIQFPRGDAVGKRICRKMLEELGWTPEAVEWIYVDLWPRILEVLQDWQDLTFDEDAAATKIVKAVMDHNFRVTLNQIVKLEAEMYETLFDRLVRG